MRRVACWGWGWGWGVQECLRWTEASWGDRGGYTEECWVPARSAPPCPGGGVTPCIAPGAGKGEHCEQGDSWEYKTQYLHRHIMATAIHHISNLDSISMESHSSIAPLISVWWLVRLRTRNRKWPGDRLLTISASPSPDTAAHLSYLHLLQMWVDIHFSAEYEQDTHTTNCKLTVRLGTADVIRTATAIFLSPHCSLR